MRAASSSWTWSQETRKETGANERFFCNKRLDLLSQLGILYDVIELYAGEPWKMWSSTGSTNQRNWVQHQADDKFGLKIHENAGGSISIYVHKNSQGSISFWVSFRMLGLFVQWSHRLRWKPVCGHLAGAGMHQRGRRWPNFKPSPNRDGLYWGTAAATVEKPGQIPWVFLHLLGFFVK